MATNDAEGLSDEDEATKCVCTTCGNELSTRMALECAECGCFFCSASCAQKDPRCNGKIHH